MEKDKQGIVMEHVWLDVDYKSMIAKKFGVDISKIEVSKAFNTYESMGDLYGTVVVNIKDLI